MAVPNAYVKISGSKATLKPTGGDDHDNIVEAADAIKGLANPVLSFEKGTFQTSKQIVLEDFDGLMVGQGNRDSVLCAGVAGAEIDLLSDGDALSYHPSRTPSLLVAHPKSEEVYSGTYTWDTTTTIVGAGVSSPAPQVGDRIRLDDLTANPAGRAFEVLSTTGGASPSIVIDNPDATSIPSKAGGISRSVYKPSLSARNCRLEIRDMQLTAGSGTTGRIGRMRHEVRSNVHLYSVVRVLGAYTRLDVAPTLRATQVDVIRTDLDIERCSIKAELNNSYHCVLASTCPSWDVRFDPGIVADACLGQGAAGDEYQNGMNFLNEKVKPPMNGNLRIRSCELSGSLNGVSVDGWLNDRADDGPYNMPAGAETNPKILITRNKFFDIMKNTAVDGNTQFHGCVFIVACGGARVSVNRNEMKNVRSMGGYYADSPPGGFHYPDGYVMDKTLMGISGNDVSITGNLAGEDNCVWFAFPDPEPPHDLIEAFFCGNLDGVRYGAQEWITFDFGLLAFKSQPPQDEVIQEMLFAHNRIEVSPDIPGLIISPPSPINGDIAFFAPFFLTWVRYGIGDILTTGNEFTTSPPTVANPSVVPGGVAHAIGDIQDDGPGLRCTARFVDNEIVNYGPTAFGVFGIFLPGSLDSLVDVDDAGGALLWFDDGENSTLIGADAETVVPSAYNGLKKTRFARGEDVTSPT